MELPFKLRRLYSQQRTATNNLRRKCFTLRLFCCWCTRLFEKNINLSLGLANGTSVIYHSLVLDERENSEAVLAQIVDSTNANDIFLQYPPKYICGEIPNAKPEQFIGKTLVENKVVIPIPLKEENKNNSRTKGGVTEKKLGKSTFLALVYDK